MRFAYADPPYFGSAKRIYGKHHPKAAVYDTLAGHRKLVKKLCSDFPDGWALSMGASNLKTILPLCPKDCRVGAWIKPFCFMKKGVPVSYAWEPVVWRGGRPRPKTRPYLRDFVVANSPTRHSCPFPGSKPEEVCFWIFEILGMSLEDEFVDLFPGSGAVGKAWDHWKRIRPLFDRAWGQ